MSEAYPDNVATAERALVGAALTDGQCYYEASLNPEQFFDPKLRAVWTAIGQVLQQDVQVDELTVGDRLTEMNYLEAVGGYAYLAELTVGVLTTSNVEYLSSAVRDAWLKRSLASLTADLDNVLYAAESGSDLLHKVRAKLDNLEANSGQPLPTMGSLVDDEVASIREDIGKLERGEQVLVGLPTGLGIEAVVPGGIPLDKVTTIYGESGNFKSTFKNNIVWNIAASGVGTVLDVSLEDTDRLTTQRFIASSTGLSYGKIAGRVLNGSDLSRLNVPEERRMLADNVILGETVAPHIDEIIRVARYHKKAAGCVAVFVDYLQLLEGAEDHTGLMKIMQKAQLAAKRDGMSYVFVSQVKQEVDDRAQKKEDARPRITDMIGGSAMRFASKLSMGLYRPYKYERIPKKPKGRSVAPDYTGLFNNHPDGETLYKMIMEVWLEKNVLGEPSVCVPVLVNPATGGMTPMPTEIKELL